MSKDHAAPYSVARLPPRLGRLRVLTWNINSVRLRLTQMLRLARLADPDVICLQETKCEDAKFPAARIAAAGYPHQAYHGDKGYNGVAILSRLPIARRDRRFWAGKEDSRHVVAEIAGIELHDVYIPAGGDIPDPEVNQKFAHKLRFLDELAQWWGNPSPHSGGRMLVGDLNVAPLETDVWSHRQLLDVVSHTPPETTRFEKARAAHGWIDAVRMLHPEPRRIYTWWSYRNQDWAASDRGRRLDHVWITSDLVPHLAAVYVLKPCRNWLRTSDHVPVVVDLGIKGAP